MRSRQKKRSVRDSDLRNCSSALDFLLGSVLPFFCRFELVRVASLASPGRRVRLFGFFATTTPFVPCMPCCVTGCVVWQGLR